MIPVSNQIFWFSDVRSIVLVIIRLAFPEETRITETDTMARKWKNPLVLFVIGNLLLLAVLNRVVFAPDTTLLAIDYNFGVLKMVKEELPGSFLGTWHDGGFAGVPVTRSLSLSAVLLWLLPLDFYTDWIYGLCLVAGSCFFMLYLRRRGIGWSSCAFGCLTAFWVGVNLTTIYSGHLNKYFILVFAPLFLWCYDLALERRRVSLSILAGGAFGSMFIEQADVGFLFATILGPYALFACWRDHGRDLGAWLRVPVVSLFTAFVLASPMLMTGYTRFVKNVGVMEGDALRKWEFATQWSWPPEESIDFVAPGYMGWKVDDPDGPYWGKMGRSPGWSKPGDPGLANFKLENHYVSLFPLAFAAWSLVSVWRLRGKGCRASKDLWFWAAALMVSWLLACGKYLPLYEMFYQLPVVSSVRVPTKFFHVFQLALGFLAAFGLDALLKQAARGESSIGPHHRKVFVSCAVLLVLVSGVSWYHVRGSATGTAGVSMEGPAGEMMRLISDNKVQALGHAFVVALFLSIIAAVLLFRRWGGHSWARSLAAWFLVVLMVGEAYLLSRHYFVGIDTAPIRDNPVARFLKERIGPHRHDLATRSGFYNNWLTIDMHYHLCRAFTPAATPRMKVDMQELLAHLPPPRVWMLASVRSIVAPATMAEEIMKAEPYKAVYWFDVAPRKDFQVDVIEVEAGKKDAHCILELPEPNRYALVNQWDFAEDDEALDRLASPAFRPLEQIVVPPGTEGLPPVFQTQWEELGHTQKGEKGHIQIVDYSSRRAVLEVDSPRDAILRIGEHFDPGWSALIDGKPAPIFRCDYLFQGLTVPKGAHTIEIRFERNGSVFAIQVLVYGICTGALLVFLRSRSKEKPLSQPTKYSIKQPASDDGE